MLPTSSQRPMMPNELGTLPLLFPLASGALLRRCLPSSLAPSLLSPGSAAPLWLAGVYPLATGALSQALCLSASR